MEDRTGVTAPKIDENTAGAAPGLLGKGKGKGKGKAIDPIPDEEMGDDEEASDEDEDDGEDEQVS